MYQIFVSGLSYSLDDHNLREEFVNYGTIVEGISSPFLVCTHLGTTLQLADMLYPVQLRLSWTVRLEGLEVLAL
jgi:hypothetical protein